MADIQEGEVIAQYGWAKGETRHKAREAIMFYVLAFCTTRAWPDRNMPGLHGFTPEHGDYKAQPGDLYHGEHPVDMTPNEARAEIASRKQLRGNWCECPLHTLFPQRVADLVAPTLLDLQAACDLIGKDTYGKPHWTPETISPCNPVVQAFARHALAIANKEPTA